MTTFTKLTGFFAVLAAVYALTFAIGKTVGPIEPPGADNHQIIDQGVRPEGHGAGHGG